MGDLRGESREISPGMVFPDNAIEHISFTVVRSVNVIECQTVERGLFWGNSLEMNDVDLG
jgi:hypothetical protein